MLLGVTENGKACWLAPAGLFLGNPTEVHIFLPRWSPRGQFGYACANMNFHKPHYLTIATFRITDAHSSNEVTIDEHMPFNAEIRKVCICGASIQFNLESRRWLCSGSGSELNVNRWNCVPLITEGDFEKLDVSDLKDAHCTSQVTFGEDNGLTALLKVEAKDRWIISDPLPIFEHLSVKPFETDLLLRWFLSFEDNLSSGLSFEIFWNLADPKDRQIVERLYSSQSITIYFVDSSSLDVIGATDLELYQPSIQSSVKQALALITALPNDEIQRREQLSAFALGQEASMFSFADKMGMCPVATGYLFAPTSLSREEITEMSQHVQDCPLCQNFRRS